MSFTVSYSLGGSNAVSLDKITLHLSVGYERGHSVCHLTQGRRAGRKTNLFWARRQQRRCADSWCRGTIRYRTRSVFVRLKPAESVGRTAANGKFRFEIPQPEPKKWDRVDIIATHPDYALGWQNLLPQSTADIELQLGTPNLISGKIMNEMGEPIQNAEVRVYSLSRAEHYLRLDEIPMAPAKTEANGDFVLRELPQGMTTTINIQGPGYAKQTHNSVPIGAEGLEFRLKREGRIEGRLSYAETEVPVEGAAIAFEAIHPTYGYGKTTTDANGNYLLKNLSPGMYNLILDKGPEGWTAVAREFVEVVEGQTTANVDLTLVKGGFITGRLTSRDTQKPIPDHWLKFNGGEPESRALFHHNYETYTDENGTYRFYVPPGQIRLYTQAPQNYLGSRDMIERYLDVVEGQTVVSDFQFARGEELEVQVLTEDGKPVVGAFISYKGQLMDSGQSDQRGRFTIGGLEIGQELTLTAEHGKLRLRGMKRGVKVRKGGSVKIRMQQYGWGKVSGRVVNVKGEPIPSANIVLKHHLANQTFLSWSGTVAITDGDGWFKDVELIAGDAYTISAEAKGYQRAEATAFIATTEMTEIETLILPEAGQFFIEGRITDTDGEPVHGAQVRTHAHPGQSWYTNTNKNGAYRLDTLSMGLIHRLYIDHPKYANHIFKGLKTNQRHDLVLVKADGYLAGKVVDAAGKPIARARVKIHPQEDPSTGYQYAEDWTNVRGQFELKHIKDEAVSLHVTPPGVSYYPTDDDDYQSFEVSVNQRNLTLTLDKLRTRE